MYDVIVVGGGTSGCVLAARLSENERLKVLLLEAGDSDTEYPEVISESRLGSQNVVGKGHHKVRFLQRLRYGISPIIMLRGNVLGGTSSINYMAAVRATPQDFADWTAKGCEGWAWDQVEPYFRKVETDTDFSGLKAHGDTGPILLRRWRLDRLSGVHKAIFDGLQEAGVPVNSDINSAEHSFGVGILPGTVSDDGKTRLTMSQAYLTPSVRARQNLHIKTQAKVARLIIENNEANGVELIGGERIYAATVFVCAGVFESPKLLMLSGIGPEKELAQHNIPVLKNAPAVGANLQDHMGISLLYRAPYKQPLEGSPAKVVWVGHMDGSLNADFQILPTPVLNKPVLGEVASVLAFNMLPSTKGRLRLASNNPAVNPELDLNFLVHDDDIKMVLEPLKKIIEWEKTEAFKAWGARRIGPFKIPTTIAEFRRAKRFFSISYFHLTSTCAMGAEDDENAVLNSRCQVKGINNLYVVDASAMPQIVRVNPYLTCVVMAEKVADEFLVAKAQQVEATAE